LPKRGLYQFAKRTTDNNPAAQCWDESPDCAKFAPRTAIRKTFGQSQDLYETQSCSSAVLLVAPSTLTTTETVSTPSLRGNTMVI
jgi:hypothetical protein